MKEVKVEVDEHVLVLYNVLNEMFHKGKYPISIERNIKSLMSLLSRELKKDVKYDKYEIVDYSWICCLKLTKK